MGDCFITRRGGGTSKAFAAIGVTYPAGSTCTCTDGTKTLTLKNTSGQGLFIIPYAATWTVTATDGTNTKSESVEITSEGQSVSVALSYRHYIFQSGVGLTDGLTIAGYFYGGGSVNSWTPTITNEHIYTNSGDHGWFITENIDMSKYSILRARVLVKSIGRGFSLRVNNAVQSGTAMEEYTATAAIDSGSVNTETIISLPLDGVSDRSSLYLGWEMRDSENYVYDVWLE